MLKSTFLSSDWISPFNNSWTLKSIFSTTYQFYQNYSNFFIIFLWYNCLHNCINSLLFHFLNCFNLKTSIIMNMKMLNLFNLLSKSESVRFLLNWNRNPVLTRQSVVFHWFSVKMTNCPVRIGSLISIQWESHWLGFREYIYNNV